MDSVPGRRGEEPQSQPQPPAQSEESRRVPRTASPSYMGKHRLTAAVNHLNQQIQIIQEELDELETLGESSLVCKELAATIESLPDPLLPVTRGPAVVGWDRWFQGAHGSGSRKRWL